MLATQECKIPVLGRAYYNDKGMTNIIGLSQMGQKYRVTYDSEKEPAFYIHMPGKIVTFSERTEEVAIDMVNLSK